LGVVFNSKRKHLVKALLTDRIRQSDKAAFNDLFGLFYRKLCRFAYVILQNSDMAEETVQDVFVRLWENRQTLSISTSIDSFLFVSVRNAALNQFKLSAIRKKYEAEAFDLPETVEFDSSLFMEHLQKAISKLPEQCRMIYHLKSFEGLTYTEISDYLEISEKTAENQVHIAVTKLKQMLYPYKDRFFNT
jgi:RNA polymerase sigma-70 factor, ECF subfamily